MTVHNGRSVSDAVIAALLADGLLVGDGEKPDGGGWQGTPGQSTFNKYVTVHPLLGGIVDGTIGDVHADAELVYQFTAVGSTRAMCEAVADHARLSILTSPLTIPDRTVMLVAIDLTGGARRDDTVQPAVWMSAERYRLFTTPA